MASLGWLPCVDVITPGLTIPIVFFSAKLRIRVSIVAIALSGWLAAQAGAESEGLQAQVQSLLPILASPSFEARESASATLVSLGMNAAPFIQSGLPGLEGEARLRAEAILARLSTPRQKGNFPKTATLVTMDVKDRPLSDVARRLATFSRSRIRMAGPMSQGAPRTSQDFQHPKWNQLVTFQAAEAPFFEVLDRLGAQLGLIATRDYMTGDILWSDGRAEDGLIQYVGPLRVALTSVTITKQSRFSGTPWVSGNLQFRCDVEQDADVVGMLHPLEISPSVDQLDREITFRVPSPSERFLIPLDRRRQFHLGATMNPPANDARLIRELRVRIPVVVADEVVVVSTSLQKADPVETAPERLPMDFQIESQETVGDHQSLVFSFIPPEISGETSLPQTPGLDELEVFAEGGEPLPLSPIQAQFQNGRQRRTLTILSGSPQRLRFRTLARYRIESIETVFKEVPLP